MNKKILIATTLILIGVFGRIFFRNLLPATPHIYIDINGLTQPLLMMDMFFIVAIVSILSGMLLGKRYSLLVPFTIMLITDIYYGNSFILLFTWSGFMMLGLIGHLLKEKVGINRISILVTPLAGAGGVILYDIWTNFGCWLGWYPHSLEGLMLCYTLAIPFTLWHLLSTVSGLFVVSVITVVWKEHSDEIKNKLFRKKVQPVES